MKKIFITAHSLELGGIERSLLGLLENLDYSQYQVDLFLLRHTGELMPHLPKGVRLLPKSEAYSCLGIPLVDALRKGQFGVALGRLQGRRLARKRTEQLHVTGDSNISNEYSHKYTVNRLPMMSDEEYDLAVSFASPHYFVAQKVKAKKKIAWIHTDYQTMEVDAPSELKMWDAYDYIASISDDVTGSFLHTFPTLKEKIVLIENILPVSIMREQAAAFSVQEEMPEDGAVRLLSVGRYCTQKNFDNIPEICSLIRKQGCNVVWYIIGYGPDEGLIQSKIAQYGMQAYVKLLGKKENPYPYFRGCDLYVQPSRYEGKSIAVREAQILHKPVVITNYTTAHSQVEDGVDGLIVPMENAACANAIADAVRNTELLRRLSENTRSRDYVGAAQVHKLYALIEE